ncbi:uncharacterized protein TNIN_356261 [Trichonephila inaurata madagascariensis]|uniref:Uncharacterized protein n=1 Tax=Trichonephila inaurata madagascariensis TaxID=2747483 RepID=A0A8X6X2S2_9ARAC|nr:uncharacterized protein TNIN_356261 [Trichonephila inaurata madagascariensis]
MSEHSFVKRKHSGSRKIPSAESYLTLHERIQSVSQEIRNPASPPGMKKVIQESTDKVLCNIRDQLAEFAKFTIDLQNTTPAEWQLSTDTSTPSTTETSDQKFPQSASGWPHNAPLRDAFQMVRNLLWRMSSVIDQVCLELPIESNIFTPSQSQLFNLYYTQYVFQLSLFVLQTIIEQLEGFSKVIYENSGDKVAVQTSGASSKTDPRPKNVYKKHKSRIFVAGKEYKSPNVEESLSSSEEISELPESRLPHKQELKKRASHAVEVLLLLLENMLVHYRPDRVKRFGSTGKQFSSLCPRCSIPGADDLRRYSSRENLHVERFQKSSHEVSFLQMAYYGLTESFFPTL